MERSLVLTVVFGLLAIACGNEPERASDYPRPACGYDGHPCGNGSCCGAEEMCGNGKNGCAEDSCCFIGPTNRRPGPQPLLPPIRHR